MFKIPNIKHISFKSIFNLISLTIYNNFGITKTKNMNTHPYITGNPELLERCILIKTDQILAVGTKRSRLNFFQLKAVCFEPVRCTSLPQDVACRRANFI